MMTRKVTIYVNQTWGLGGSEDRLRDLIRAMLSGEQSGCALIVGSIVVEQDDRPASSLDDDLDRELNDQVLVDPQSDDADFEAALDCQS